MKASVISFAIGTKGPAEYGSTSPMRMGSAAKAEAPAVSNADPAAATTAPTGPVSDLRAAVDSYERTILADTMARCRFNQKVAAEALGLSYDQIRHALKKHGLNQ